MSLLLTPEAACSDLIDSIKDFASKLEEGWGVGYRVAFTHEAVIFENVKPEGSFVAITGRFQSNEPFKIILSPAQVNVVLLGIKKDGSWNRVVGFGQIPTSSEQTGR